VALINSKPFTFRPKGLSEAIDATNAFPGAMNLLSNLVPNPSNDNQFVCRPAAVQATNFTGFNTPTTVTALIVVGNFAWGMVSTSRFAGKDEPFCYNISTGLFVPISNVTSGNTPTTPTSTGDWTPPTMYAVTSGRIMITHPGYNGTTQFIGWIDISSFSSATITGNTHGTTTVDGLSSNVLTAGWQVGMQILGSSGDIPAGTYITAIAAGGTSITISQAATGSHAGQTFTVTGGTPAAPLYGSGNTNTNPLSAVATAVAGYNGRAWYAVGNSVVFSDSLNPTQVTNASQALIFGDSTPVTALAGLPLTSQITGGSIQSLIVFKGAQPYYQVTGDQATSNLAVNAVNGSVGTLAPNSIAACSKGLIYVAPDGVRILGFAGTVSDPLGRAGIGVATAFTNAINPSRMAAAFNNNVYRVSCQPNTGSQANIEFFFDFDRAVWTGPHSFPAALIRPVFTGLGNTFLSAAVGVNGALWASGTDPTPTSTYTENSVALTFDYQPTLLPDTGTQSGVCIVQTTIGLQLPNSLSVNCLAANEAGFAIDQEILTSPGTGGSIWNAFNWGAGVWGASLGYFKQYAINWARPIVVRQLVFQVNGASAAGFVIGNVYFNYQTLNYQLP
jgi:hypothetical protein